MAVKVVDNYYLFEEGAVTYHTQHLFKDEKSFPVFQSRSIPYRTQHLFIDKNGFPRAVIVEYQDQRAYIVTKIKDCEIPKEVTCSAHKYILEYIRFCADILISLDRNKHRPVSIKVAALKNLADNLQNTKA